MILCGRMNIMRVPLPPIFLGQYVPGKFDDLPITQKYKMIIEYVIEAMQIP